MKSGAKNPLVTIGIPTYNRADKLHNVIERSLAQTYRNLEVIVSDNCSSDQTPELVRSITDPRLRYFRQETNIGPNNNFNYCLSQARGEYFLLFHDDDTIDEDFVEACIASLRPGQSVGAILTGVRIIDEHDDVLKQHENRASAESAAEFIRGWFRGQPALYLCSTLYNTVKLREIGGFRSKRNLYDDLVPTFTLVTRYGRADVPGIKAGFRRHSGNRGATVPIDDWVEDARYLLDVICRLLPDDCRALRLEGNRYFCEKMYHKVATGLAVSRSPLDYFRIYRAFDYCYSPLRHFYGPKLSRRVRRLKWILIGNPRT